MRARILAWLIIAVLVALGAQNVALASFRDEAPADEYFGPFKVSVLEIRNRLTRFEGQQNRELSSESTLHGIDAVEIAIEDWHRKYPHDSWLPGFLSRIVRVYVRADAGRNAHARHAYALLETEYRRTRPAHEAAQAARRMFI